jgi:hypothetical protein
MSAIPLTYDEAFPTVKITLYGSMIWCVPPSYSTLKVYSPTSNVLVH